MVGGRPNTVCEELEEIGQFERKPALSQVWGNIINAYQRPLGNMHSLSIAAIRLQAQASLEQLNTSQRAAKSRDYEGGPPQKNTQQQWYLWKIVPLFLHI